jgi:YfiH family protein
VIDRSTVEPIEDFRDFGIDAFTTTRKAGTFGTNGDDPVSSVMGRWYSLQTDLARTAPRLVTARQVHGARVVTHGSGWRGWLRIEDADGHLAAERGTAMAVTVADCVPLFLAHPSGVAALLHSGWRGTVAGILGTALGLFQGLGLRLSDLAVHLGPAICGTCYEVSPDVHAQLTGKVVERPTPVDLRDVLASQAQARGVRRITVSPFCTRCHQDRFFSHRGGDAGRQIGVLTVPS